LTQPWSTSYNQTLPTGAQVSVGFNGQKLSTNNSFQLYTRPIRPTSRSVFQQPLLPQSRLLHQQTAGYHRPQQFRLSQYTLQDSVMKLVSGAELAYWAVVGARENLRVQEKALELADAALKRAQRELELGASSPLDIFQPQAQYANAELSVTQARYNLAQVEDALRKQIAVDLDPNLRNLPVVLTESVDPPVTTAKLDREALVETALRTRPDLRANMQQIDVDDLSAQRH